MEEKEYKVLSTSAITGVSKSSGNPYTKVILNLERMGQTLEVFSFDTGLINTEGQTITGHIEQNEFRGKIEYKFVKAGSQSYQPRAVQAPVVNTGMMEKLDEILGILKANFPTAYNMKDDNKDLRDEEITF